MSGQNTIIEQLKALGALVDAGYALAFHIDYTRPTFLFQTYPEDWASEYSDKGLVMSDPTVHWGFENEGTRRWSDLVSQDTGGVLALAAEYGLTYGVTCAVEMGGTRSMCSFARGDREYTDDESAKLLACATALHEATAELKALPSTMLGDLEKMGVRVSQPGGQ